MDKYSGYHDVQMWQLFLEIFELNDDFIVEEVINLDYVKHSDLEKIINNFIQTGKISKKEREKLIAYYLLTWYDDELED